MFNSMQVQYYLKGLSYPARKEDLVAQARVNGAQDNLLEMLSELPDIEFKAPGGR